MRTRLSILAALALGVLLALPTAAPATQGPGPGHHGSSGTGSAVDHGSRGSGSGGYADSSGSGSGGSSGTGSGHDGANDDEAAAGAQHETQSPGDNPTASIPANPTPANPTPAAGPPVGRVADRQAAHPRLSTDLSPGAGAAAAAATPGARASAAALIPTSVAVAAAVLVLAAMVGAGFRARARLGRLG